MIKLKTNRVILVETKTPRNEPFLNRDGRIISRYKDGSLLVRYQNRTAVFKYPADKIAYLPMKQ